MTAQRIVSRGLCAFEWFASNRSLSLWSRNREMAHRFADEATAAAAIRALCATIPSEPDYFDRVLAGQYRITYPTIEQEAAAFSASVPQGARS